mmetsp:Transcript_14017/g.58552  ORF Transcript_14017/g.58552 Transcript_14017/m.58552 type:complete len:255 (+) Transcript_14017:532-1296(+)
MRVRERAKHGHRRRSPTSRGRSARSPPLRGACATARCRPPARSPRACERAERSSTHRRSPTHCGPLEGSSTRMPPRIPAARTLPSLRTPARSPGTRPRRLPAHPTSIRTRRVDVQSSSRLGSLRAACGVARSWAVLWVACCVRWARARSAGNSTPRRRACAPTPWAHRGPTQPLRTQWLSLTSALRVCALLLAGARLHTAHSSSRWSRQRRQSLGWLIRASLMRSLQRLAPTQALPGVLARARACSRAPTRWTW